MATVRHRGVVESPRGLGHRDHVCWCYDDDRAYARDVVAFLTDGAAGGDRLWVIGDRPAEALLPALAQLPARDDLLAGGHLQVSSFTDVLGAAEDFNLQTRLAGYQRSADAAVAAGYRGLRVSVDVTPLAAGGHAGRLPSCELAVDRLIGSTALTVLCGYDERRVSHLQAIRAVHPLQGRSGAVGFSLSPAEDTASAFRLTGELDLGLVEPLAAALRAAAEASSGPLLLDLADLQFLDCAATRVLAHFALALHVADRPVQLRGPSRLVTLCLDTFDLGPLIRQ